MLGEIFGELLSSIIGDSIGELFPRRGNLVVMSILMFFAGIAFPVVAVFQIYSSGLGVSIASLFIVGLYGGLSYLSFHLSRKAWREKKHFSTSEWVSEYFRGEQAVEAVKTLNLYGTDTTHIEVERIRRNAIIISQGSLEILEYTISVAKKDPKSVLVREETDNLIRHRLNSEKIGC